MESDGRPETRGWRQEDPWPVGPVEFSQTPQDTTCQHRDSCIDSFRIGKTEELLTKEPCPNFRPHADDEVRAICLEMVTASYLHPSAYVHYGTLIDSRSPSTATTLAVVIVAVLGDAAEASAEHLHACYGLSPREVELARLLADGLSTRELSTMLGVSTHTARHHTENVLRKLRMRRRTEVGRRLRGG